MARKLLVTIIALIGILAMVLPGCATPEPEPEVRTTGPFLDSILISKEVDSAAAVLQLKNNDIDLFAFAIANAALYQSVLADPNLATVSALGTYNELTFNPVGPVFNGTGKLNPFAVKQFREAMNWLVNRDYIAGEIMGGLGQPRYTCISPSAVDGSLRYPDLLASIKAKYGYNVAKAEAVVTPVMTGLNATKEGGKWMYKGAQVELIGLIRTEDERRQMGDYFATQLENLGFKVTRTYGTGGTLADGWQGDPNRGVFNFYTAGWASTAIPLDEGGNFGFFYSPWGYPGISLWGAYTPDPAFDAVALKLNDNNFATMEERKSLFQQALPASMEDSVRIFLVTRAPFFPMRKNVRLASDLFGGVYGSWMWAQAAHFVDDAGKPIVGGTLRIATTDILTNPWNPVAGTNWVYDMMPIRATADQDTQPDTRTGLRWPGRLQKGELFVKQGQPIEVKNTDWCKLTFVPENVVPLDAWADWDATTQTFLTVRDRFGPSGTTAVRKSVAYFPKDIFSVPLHDGSTLSMGDFIMRAILQFDRAKPASAIYDSNYVASYNAWVGTFKGVKFITDNPDYGLIVEFYSDFCPLNGEVGFIPTQATFWPEYSQGPGMWHTVALGVMCEASKELAFSEKKAGTLGVPWMTFIAGASKAKLKSKLDSAVGTGEIPYAPTLGQYVSTEQAKERYSNLLNWYNARGHFWVASGPFYLHSVQVTADVIQLERFENYPDPMDRWLFLLEEL